MWKDVSPRTSPCEALKAHLWRRRFMDRLKKSVSKMMTTSFLCDLIGWDVNIRMRLFFFLTAHFTSFAFPLSSKCNRAKGCVSSPMDVTSSRGFAVQRGEACVGHQFVGNAIVGSKTEFSHIFFIRWAVFIKDLTLFSSFQFCQYSWYCI